MATPGDALANRVQSSLAADRWPQPSWDSAAAQVIAASTLADERVFRLVFWWLRRPRFQAELRVYLRRGWVWSDEEIEVAAVLQPPRSDRGQPIRRGRMVAAYATLAGLSLAAMLPFVWAGLVVLLGLLLALPGSLNYAPVAVLLGLIIAVGAAGRGYWRLAKAKPKDAYFFSNFARASQALPGKGSQFLTGLVGFADQRSWTLALLTAHPRLVRYYEHHGFEVTRSVQMPWRETTHLMVRRPKNGDTP